MSNERDQQKWSGLYTKRSNTVTNWAWLSLHNCTLMWYNSRRYSRYSQIASGTVTHVLSGKLLCWEGILKIFNFEVNFQSSSLIPTEQTLQFVRSERAVAPCEANSFNAACCWRRHCLLVWYFHLPADLNFVWVGIKKDRGKVRVARRILTPFSYILI